MIQFQDRNVPEKQNIDVSFINGNDRHIMFYDDDDEPVLLGLSGSRGLGYAAFRIRHTARTWGADLEALLSNHLKTIIVSETTARRFIRVNSGKIAGVVSAAFFISVLIGIYLAGSRMLNDQNQEVYKFTGSAIPLDKKVDLILGIISSGLWERFFLFSLGYMVVGFVITIIIGIWIEKQADSIKPSFILLTRQSEQNKTTLIKRYERKWLGFIFSLLTGIATGVIGNIIFTKLWS